MGCEHAWDLGMACFLGVVEVRSHTRLLSSEDLSERLFSPPRDVLHLPQKVGFGLEYKLVFMLTVSTCA